MHSFINYVSLHTALLVKTVFLFHIWIFG